MSEELFQKEALEQLASAQQLDLPIEITTPKAWVASLALLVLMLVVVIWSIVGRLPITVSGPGILLSSPHRPFSALVAGQVLEILVKPGDIVRAGQLVARMRPVNSYPKVSRVDINAPFAGRVVHVEAQPGQLLQVGEVLLQASSTETDLKAVLFLPVNQGKRVRPNMVCRISPSTADESEYGFVYGRVMTVANYPSDHEDMLAVLGNEDLIKFFLGGGSIYQQAPIKVVVDLEQDPSTPSGYMWSSGKGPNFGLGSGTVCQANVVVDSNRPVDLVIPYLDKVFGASPW